ncbi:MAG: hypothetical protein HY286_04990 [Planctomycetes bacterium]|nr:hypothetical protein [Planctomycetota bacterium]
MDPSEARRESLQLHDELRRAMRDALILSTRVKNGEFDAGPQLRASVRDLERAVRSHIDVENHDLAPVLKTIDAWGSVRCGQLENAHKQELLAIYDAEAALLKVNFSDRRCWSEFAMAVHGLVRGVLKCLRFEETHLLDPHTLRDDILVVDNIDG